MGRSTFKQVVSKRMKTLITLDGRQGEGGGQILRSALSLSMMTGTAIELKHIRGGRPKPGLMRQHLVCVEAAQRLSYAQVEGAELNSQRLLFAPQRSDWRPIGTEHLRFDIGTAGSTSLVLQTLLPVLMHKGLDADIEVLGGTHNPLAPSTDFLQRCFAPQINALGLGTIDLQLRRYGLAPKGGGEIAMRYRADPRAGDAHAWMHRLQQRTAVKLSLAVIYGGRAPDALADKLATFESALQKLSSSTHGAIARDVIDAGATGPGMVLQFGADLGCVQELITLYPSRNESLERLSERGARELKRYLQSEAHIGTHLADQLLLPLAIAGGGSFSAMSGDLHLATNAWVLEQFGFAKVQLREVKPAHGVDFVEVRVQATTS
jgi:RNA 3'-terminal phosphate cyclase (ATP)